MLFFVFFFALWMLLNGRVTADVIVVGIVISAIVTVFACKICGWNSAKNAKVLKITGMILSYAGNLFIEIIKANIDMLKVIYSKNCSAVQPQIFTFDTQLKDEVSRTVLANSITITPGTYTVGVKGNRLTVHGINPEFAEGTPESELNLRLIAMEKALREKAGKK